MKHFIGLLVLIACVTVTHFVKAEDKLPAPNDTAQKQAALLIANLFKADYDAAKTPDQRSDLAKKMLQVGIDSKDDPTGRYVLLRIARDVAADAGDIQTATTAVDQLSNLYDVDGLSMQSEVLAKVVKALRLPKDHQELGPRIQQAIREAIVQDRFEVAKTIAETALDSARHARSADLMKQAVAQSKDIEALEEEFQKVTAAFETLKSSPTDPKANLLVGEYRCFVKSDWENGLLMLVLGSDAKLKALAESELAEKPDTLELGHAWWGYSESAEGKAQSAAQIRAAVWYKQALPGLDGLSKKLVESRVAEVSAISISKTKQLREKFAPDAIEFNGRYYKVVAQNGITWADAVKACETAGGRLAHFDTKELQNKVYQMKGRMLVWVESYGDTRTDASVGKYAFLWKEQRNGAARTDNRGPVYSGKTIPMEGFVCEWEE